MRRLAVDGTTVTATVDGTHVYGVGLEAARIGLRGRCACRYGSEGVFCKHCVGVAVAWLADGAVVGEPPAGAGVRRAAAGADLRTAHRTKRALREELDQAGMP